MTYAVDVVEIERGFAWFEAKSNEDARDMLFGLIGANNFTMYSEGESEVCTDLIQEDKDAEPQYSSKDVNPDKRKEIPQIQFARTTVPTDKEIYGAYLVRTGVKTIYVEAANRSEAHDIAIALCKQGDIVMTEHDVEYELEEWTVPIERYDNFSYVIGNNPGEAKVYSREDYSDNFIWLKGEEHE